MMKFLKYILERGETVNVEAIPGPPPNPKNIQECFEKVFEHEVANTKGVYNIVKLSLDEQDWATWNFAQWFVKEQIEEETLAMNLLAKIKVAGGSNVSNDTLYMIDNDLKNMPDDAELARNTTTDNP
jgi:ferritin